MLRDGIKINAVDKGFKGGRGKFAHIRAVGIDNRKDIEKNIAGKKVDNWLHDSSEGEKLYFLERWINILLCRECI